MHRALRAGLIGASVAAVGIQLVPYGRDHADGPVRTSVAWPSAAAESLFRGACADCHTSTTDWPWYSHVAPMSWLVQRDVDRGRDAWNLSEEVDDLENAAEVTADGSMPPRQYELAHPEARLSAEEEATLVAALEAMDEQDGDDDGSGRGRGRGRGGDD